MTEAPKDKPKSGISIDFNTPSDILAQVLYNLESRRARVVLEDHFMAEGSMSPIPKGKQLKVSLKIPWNQIESEIPRLIQEINEKVYAALKGEGVDENADDPYKRWRYFISLPVSTTRYHDYGKGYGKKATTIEGEGIFISGGCNTILAIRAESLKKLHDITQHIMEDVTPRQQEG